MRRIVSCTLLKGHRREAMPLMPSDEGPKTPKWLDRWMFERAGKRITVAVEVHDESGVSEVVDARQFIERLAEFPPGVGFDIYVEEAPCDS